jgi:hypothetical protein
LQALSDHSNEEIFLRRRFWLSMSLPIALSAIGCTHIATNGALNPSPASQSKIVLIPNTVDFSTVAVGQKNTQTVKITNEDTKVRQISAVQIAGAGLTISGLKFPFSLAPQASETFNIEFAPTTIGQVNGQLTIDSSVTGTETFLVKGLGTKVSAKLELTPSVVNFGNTSIKQTVTQKMTVANTGSSKVTVSRVIIGGAGFEVSELPAHFDLGPQQEKSFLVSFFPTVKGPATGALTFVSKDLGPVTISMTGVGVNGGAEPAKSSHTVTLGWEPSPGNVAGYSVYRGEGPSASAIFTKLTASPLSTVNYRDADVASGTEYQYFVTSVSHTGKESAHSDGVSVTIPNP